MTCYVGPIRQTIEQITNNLLNSIHIYCREKQVELTDLFYFNQDKNMTKSIINSKQFQDGLKKAKIPFPIAQIDNIIKYLVRIWKYFFWLDILKISFIFN